MTTQREAYKEIKDLGLTVTKPRGSNQYRLNFKRDKEDEAFYSEKVNRILQKARSMNKADEKRKAKNRKVIGQTSDRDFKVTLEEWEEAVFDNHDHFTVVRYRARLKHDTRVFKDFPDAVIDARKAGRPLIYCVAKSGRFFCIEEVRWDYFMDRWFKLHPELKTKLVRPKKKKVKAKKKVAKKKTVKSKTSKPATKKVIKKKVTKKKATLSVKRRKVNFRKPPTKKSTSKAKAKPKAKARKALKQNRR